MGKDTLIKNAKIILKNNNNFNFVKRYITREPDSSEMNYYLEKNAFELLCRNNHFISKWEAHGNYYAIAKECIDKKINIISISRQHIKDFEKVFKDVVTIHVSVPKDILVNRLKKRGRENEAEIIKRMERSYEKLQGKIIIEFDNNEKIEKSSKNFVELLKKLANI